MSQTTLTDDDSPTPYRSIVKDAYSTRDDKTGSRNIVEIAAWRVEMHDPDAEEQIKEGDGQLNYNRILEIALADLGADEISRRTGLKSYADDQGGRAASTIQGYKQNPGRLRSAPEGGLPQSHPVKRVLRRWARSNDLGHFEGDQATDDTGEEADPSPIDLDKLKSAFRLARLIASENGLGFVDSSGDPVAVEDNERIDRDEIRPADRPLNDTKAAAQITKADGSIYEYEIDLTNRKLNPESGTTVPPDGWS